jgi:hypothetical protein
MESSVIRKKRIDRIRIMDETIHYLTVLRSCSSVYQLEIRKAIDNSIFELRGLRKMLGER